MSKNIVTLTADSGNLLVNYKNFLPCGSIVNYAGSTPPTGWLICDGSEIPILEYSNLYNIIGYTYGNDSSGNFCLPDLQDRVPLGKTGSTALGAIGGNNSVTLTTNQMPSHSHSGTSDSNGAHTHTGTTDSAGTHSHSHNANGGAGATGLASHTGSNTTTGLDGNSNGNELDLTTTTALTINEAGSHTHEFTTASNGAHTHTFTTGSIGNGDSINIRNPYIVLNYIIKY